MEFITNLLSDWGNMLLAIISICIGIAGLDWLLKSNWAARMPNWLRYLLFLPAAFLGNVFGTLIYTGILYRNFISENSYLGIALQFIYANIITYFLFFHVTYKVLPNHKLTITIITAVIGEMILLLSLLFNPEELIETILTTITIIMTIVFEKKNE